MKRRVCGMCISALLTIGVFASGQQGSSERTYTITVGIGLNDRSAQYESLEYFKEIVENNSDGRIAVELYHSGQLGDDREMMEALQRSEQEMTCPS